MPQGRSVPPPVLQRLAEGGHFRVRSFTRQYLVMMHPTGTHHHEWVRLPADWDHHTGPYTWGWMTERRPIINRPCVHGFVWTRQGCNSLALLSLYRDLRAVTHSMPSIREFTRGRRY